MLYRYFGARELDEVPPAALSAGIERMQVDLGMATDRGQRFALCACCTCWAAHPSSMLRSTTLPTERRRATSWTCLRHLATSDRAPG